MRTSHLVGALVVVIVTALGGAYIFSRPAELKEIAMDKKPATDVKVAQPGSPKPATPNNPGSAKPSTPTPSNDSTAAPSRRPQPEPTPTTNITRPKDNAVPVFTPPPAATSAPAAAESKPVPFPGLASPPTATRPVETGNLPPVAGSAAPSGTTNPPPSTPNGSPAVTPARTETPPARTPAAATRPAPANGSDSGAVRAPDRRTEPATPPTTPPAATPTGEKKTHKIESGDTLAKLAKKYLGDEKRWRKIKEANPGLDENRLLVGQELVIPGAAAAPANRTAPTTGGGTASTKPDRAARATNSPATAEPSKPVESAKPTEAAREAAPATPATHKVATGDTLIQIARKVLKDENRWREIYELNRDQLKSANDVRVGMVLKLPKAKAAAASTRPSRPSAASGNGGRSRRP